LLYGLLGPSELIQEQSPRNSRKSLKNQLDIFDRKSRVHFLCFKKFGKYFEKPPKIESKLYEKLRFNSTRAKQKPKPPNHRLRAARKSSEKKQREKANQKNKELSQSQKTKTKTPTPKLRAARKVGEKNKKQK
jgi:hypothetical protein